MQLENSASKSIEPEPHCTHIHAEPLESRRADIRAADFPTKNPPTDEERHNICNKIFRAGRDLVSYPNGEGAAEKATEIINELKQLEPLTDKDMESLGKAFTATGWRVPMRVVKNVGDPAALEQFFSTLEQLGRFDSGLLETILPATDGLSGITFQMLVAGNIEDPAVLRQLFSMIEQSDTDLLWNILTATDDHRNMTFPMLIARHGKDPDALGRLFSMIERLYAENIDVHDILAARDSMDINLPMYVAIFVKDSDVREQFFSMMGTMLESLNRETLRDIFAVPGRGNTFPMWAARLFLHEAGAHEQFFSMLERLGKLDPETMHVTLTATDGTNDMTFPMMVAENVKDPATLERFSLMLERLGESSAGKASNLN
jgi:hypothetical protein